MPVAVSGADRALASLSALSACTVGEPCILLKLGEVVLKGRNRDRFERRLHDNIRRALRGLGGIRVWQRAGVVVLRPHHAGADLGAVAQRVRDVPGIVRVHPALRVAKDPESAACAAVELLAERPSGTFAVRARRRDKRFGMNSSQLAAFIGTEVQEKYGFGVNLSRPDMEVFVEVDQREIFVFTDGLPGQGGLPVGMSGRAVVLLSGGIDSPVAAYRMMRRGLRCDFLHFSGMPFTGPESIYKAYALVRQLDQYQGDSRLFVVAFGKAQQQLVTAGADRLQIVAQRRLMLRTGEALAAQLGAAALVTGDSLGQVSSQTLANITALDDAAELPILRPLIGWDKTEIMAEARRIATLAISELPDEDCCTLLTPRYAETRARIESLHRIEKRLDAGEIVDQLLASIQEHRPSADSSDAAGGSTAPGHGDPGQRGQGEAEDEHDQADDARGAEVLAQDG